MRQKVYYLLYDDDSSGIVTSIYDVFMIIAIIISLIPLGLKNNYHIWVVTDRVTVIIFIIDYILRLMTADFKLKKGVKSFFIYPFTPLAIIDVVTILTSFTIFNAGVKSLRIARLIKSLRFLRVISALRHSKNIKILKNVFYKQRNQLILVFSFVVGYIFLAALVMFNFEPDTFDTYWDAVYWSTVSLTTIGYGDISPVTGVGRVITIISAILGIAVIALPSGIITAGYMEEVNKIKFEHQKYNKRRSRSHNQEYIDDDEENIESDADSYYDNDADSESDTDYESDMTEYIDTELRKFKDMLDEGLIDETDYTKIKKSLLDKITAD